MQLQLRLAIQTSGSDVRGDTHLSRIAHLSGISRMSAYGTKDKGAQGHGKAYSTLVQWRILNGAYAPPPPGRHIGCNR